MRHVADADARGNAGLVNQILSTFVVVYVGLGVLVAVAAAGMVVWVPYFPRLQPSQVPLARFILAVIGIRIALGFPMTVFGAVTTARQRFALNNLVATVSVIVNGAVQFTLLSRGYHVRAVVAGSVAVDLLTYAGYAWTAKRAFPGLRLRLGGDVVHQHLVQPQPRGAQAIEAEGAAQESRQDDGQDREAAGKT